MSPPPLDTNGYGATLRAALDELRQRRAEIEALRRERSEPVAIICMACRLPGGADVPRAFWDLLNAGVDATTEVPRDRWDADAYYDPDPAVVGKMITRRGGFLQHVDRFDPQFFDISPREAAGMDPQQRLVLEVAWEAIENANLPADALYQSPTGVFLGISCFDHALRATAAVGGMPTAAVTGSALDMGAGRLSYLLGLTGPSVAIDTGCSSSLVGLHLACQSLRVRDCDLALAVGVHLILSPEVMVSLSQARMLSPDGRCKTFAAAADGYSRGEGCGVVVLKRLSDARADGDVILGLVRGSAVNQNGPSSGLTVPSAIAQQRVIRRALEQAGVTPDEVGYVEAHGTGTPLGDPIEMEALGAAYGVGRAEDNPLIVGSVKTNIGHLEPASGIVGLIKVLLAFQHEMIPKHLHFQDPSRHIPWAELPVRVAAVPVAWPAGGRRRIAGISASGFSGTNAHVIVEEPPPRRYPAPSGPTSVATPGPLSKIRRCLARTRAAPRGFPFARRHRSGGDLPRRRDLPDPLPLPPGGSVGHD